MLDPSFPASSDILSAFLTQVARQGASTAILEREVPVSYAALDERSNQLARWLQTRLAGHGTEPVALCMSRGTAQIAAMLAVLKLARAYVPLDPQSPAARIEMILNDADAVAVLTDSAHASVTEAASAGVSRGVAVKNLEVAAAEIDSCSRAPLGVRCQPTDRAYVIYTSGSTGTPKGVAINHSGVTHLVMGSDFLQVTPVDRVAQVSSMAFDASVLEIYSALLNGGQLVILDAETVTVPRRLRRALVEAQVTVMWLTTSLFNQHVRSDPSMFGSLRCLMFGGEAASVEVVQQLFDQAQRPAELLNLYGPTENTAISTWHRIVTRPEDAVPIGRPVRRVVVRVMREDLQSVSPGETGELLLGGPGLAVCYHGRPALTADRFVTLDGQRLYRTGDRVRQCPTGELLFVGRTDNQVKIRGFRVELEEIEHALRGHPAVSDAAVFAEAEPGGTQRLVACIAGAMPPPSLLAFRTFLVGRLASYMIPAELRWIAQLPLNVSGKVDRHALRGLPWRTLAHDNGCDTPRSETEHEVRSLWARLLAIPEVEIGLTTDFYALGGQSLTASAIVSELAERRGIPLSFRDFLTAPTVAALSATIDALAPAAAPVIPAVAGDLPVPLSHAQEQIWLHAELAHEAVHYNEPLDLDFPEAIDPATLEAALAVLVNRHEVLRMRLVTVRGLPMQRFVPQQDAALVVHDLRSHRDPTAEALRLAEEQAKRPFDLYREAPIRFLLAQISAERSRLFIVGHPHRDRRGRNVPDFPARVEACLPRAPGGPPACAPPAAAAVPRPSHPPACHRTGSPRGVGLLGEDIGRPGTTPAANQRPRRRPRLRR